MAGFFRSIAERFRGRPVDWDELEEMLLQADLGVPTTLRLVETLRATSGFSATADEVTRRASEEIANMLPPPLPPPSDPLAVDVYRHPNAGH